MPWVLVRRHYLSGNLIVQWQLGEELFIGDIIVFPGGAFDVGEDIVNVGVGYLDESVMRRLATQFCVE